MKKIGFVGVHSGGKSTAVHGVAFHFKLRDIPVEVLPEAAREAYKRGFPINRDSNLESQLMILATQIREELLADKLPVEYLLCDRTAIDVLIYSSLILNWKQQQHLNHIASSYIALKPYHAIFIFPPRDTIAEDGIRDTDQQWQTAVKRNTTLITNKFAQTNPNTYVFRIPPELPKQQRVAHILSKLNAI